MVVEMEPVCEPGSPVSQQHECLLGNVLWLAKGTFFMWAISLVCKENGVWRLLQGRLGLPLASIPFPSWVLPPSPSIWGHQSKYAARGGSGVNPKTSMARKAYQVSAIKHGMENSRPPFLESGCQVDHQGLGCEPPLRTGSWVVPDSPAGTFQQQAF